MIVREEGYDEIVARKHAPVSLKHPRIQLALRVRAGTTADIYYRD